jgi:hypothetical protein
VEAEPEPPSGGALYVTLVDEIVVRACPVRRCVGILANEICRRRKPFQVSRFEGRLAVRGGQQLVRLFPSLSGERLSPLTDCGSLYHATFYHNPPTIGR